MAKETKNEAIERLILETAVSQTDELLRNHWPKIKEWRSESEKNKIIIPLKIIIDTSEPQPLVKTGFAIKKEIKDSVVTKLEDPNQLQLSGVGEKVPAKRGRKPVAVEE